MELIDILLLAIGWSLVSCAIARVLGGACDLGKARTAQSDDTNAGTSPRVTDEDSILGLVLECEASPGTAFFPTLVRRLSSLGGAEIPSDRAASSATQELIPDQAVVPDLGLTPSR